MDTAAFTTWLGRIGDETFILESFKGKRRDLPRASRKRGGKAAKRGLSAEQIPVIVARDRTGATIDRRPPAARRRQHHSRARAGHYPASRTVLRWRRGDHRIRAPRPGHVPCLARTRHAKAGGARSPHQQRERVPRPAEGVDAALPWRRDQEPPKLSELAANDRGPLNRLGPRRLDHGRRRTGSISTEFDIRAFYISVETRIVTLWDGQELSCGAALHQTFCTFWLLNF